MSVPIDDGIKASLATLEMVKFSYTSRVGEKALSGQEVESAKQNLNQLAQLVESMRQNLPESIIDDENDKSSLAKEISPENHCQQHSY